MRVINSAYVFAPFLTPKDRHASHAGAGWKVANRPNPAMA